MGNLVVCIAEDGCISIAANGADHHIDNGHHHHGCGCSSHHNTEEETLSRTGCTDINFDKITELKVSSTDNVIVPTAPELADTFTPFYDLKVVYQKPIWKRQSVYPPPTHISIKSTIILC